jgi:glycosyltransferase involved in cell wall biosynthesis
METRPSAPACRVCIFTSVHRPFDVRVFHREARCLAEAGYAVTLLVHAPFRREIRDGVEVVGLKPPRNRFQRFLSSWHFLWACRRQRADIFHFHDLELLPVGLILKLWTHKAIIYDCHENYPEAILERAWLPSWIKPVLSRLVAWIEPAMAKHLDAVICVVPDQEARLRQRGCKTVMVRNFPRLEIFQMPENPVTSDKIVYLGGLSIARGAHMLVEIMVELKKSHPHVRMLCLGPFNEAHVREKVMAHARNSGVADVIEYIPLVPHEEVAGHLYRARIGLVPWQPHPQLLKLCYPNKVFEYMACGLPIVASDLPGLRELIEPAQCGLLVEPESVNAHVGAICRLLDDHGKASAMGAAGSAYARSHYSWEEERKSLLRLYADMETPK